MILFVAYELERWGDDGNLGFLHSVLNVPAHCPLRPNDNPTAKLRVEIRCEEGMDQRVPLLPERHNMLSNEPDRVESHSKRRKIVVRSLLWIGEALRFDCVRHTRRGVESA